MIMATAPDQEDPADPVGGADILLAADACRNFLERHRERNWDVPIPGMDGTVAGVSRMLPKARWGTRSTCGVDRATTPRSR